MTQHTSRRWDRRTLADGPELPLFAPAANSTPTSQAAAAKAESSGRVGSLRARVLAELRRAGTYGRTNSELVAALGVPIQSICPARKALVDAGLAKVTDETRPTITGDPAAVVVAVVPASKTS